jgi:RNA polymerase sigma factor (sigma-70 family)
LRQGPPQPPTCFFGPPMSTRRESQSTSTDTHGNSQVDPWDKCYELRAPVVERAARAILGPGADCEDVVQEVFLRLMRERDRYNPEDLTVHFFRTAGRNLALNVLRRRRTRQRVRSALERESRRPASRPDRELATAEALARVSEAMESLPRRTREVARMTWLEGRTCRQIAATLGIGVKRVERHRQIARVRLVIVLGDIESRERQAGGSAGAEGGGGRVTPGFPF